MNNLPKGIIPAMVTPLDCSGNVNVESLKRLTDYLIEGGVHGLFVIGSQGEFYGLDVEQKRVAIKTVVEHVNGRVPVYAGTGATTTREAIMLTRMAADLGVDGVSVITPSFISPNADELFLHYKEIAEVSPVPVLLYNNPGRTGVNLSADLVKRLSEVPNIVGIKDSSGDMTLLSEYIRLTRGSGRFAVLAGRDTMIFAALMYGGTGSISATANVAPALAAEIYDAFVARDYERALEAQFRLAPLRIAFGLGSFPVVIKEALNLMGFDVGETVRPVGPMKPDKRDELRNILRNLGFKVVA
ncbi:MAG TPA: 4-hydroxy-tetrahydrodipicolinate synthase [Firmicutes bacterium]|nr:4-hydroxy-tetrahydrodipicolinate synthase [Bacillota bacterium]